MTSNRLKTIWKKAYSNERGGLLVKDPPCNQGDHGFEPHTDQDHGSSYDTSSDWIHQTKINVLFVHDRMIT